MMTTPSRTPRRTSTKNSGMKKTARTVAVSMPPITAVPMAIRLFAPGAGRDRQRQHAEDEGEAGHQDRPQPDARGLDRRVDDALALLLRALGEFDHQDGVLRGQAHGREQPDLEVDVVLEARAG